MRCESGTLLRLDNVVCLKEKQRKGDMDRERDRDRESKKDKKFPLTRSFLSGRQMRRDLRGQERKIHGKEKEQKWMSDLLEQQRKLYQRSG